jgi:hypothetical protein
MLLIIAGDAHRTTGGRSNHNPYLIENPISPEAAENVMSKGPTTMKEE